MGDNPLFYFCTFILYLSLGSCYYCSNLSLSLFYCIDVPSKVFDSNVDTRFGLLRRNRFLTVTKFSSPVCRQLRKFCKFTCVILRYVRNFHSIWAFSSEQVWCLKKIRLYGLFCFDRFCLLFRIASFAMLDGFLYSINSEALCNVQKC